MLKKEQVNPNRRSAHYTKQSPFENSNRQVRGRHLEITREGITADHGAKLRRRQAWTKSG